MTLIRHRRLILVQGALLVLAGCTVGPNYKKPLAPSPVSFKEPLPPGWKQAEPGGAFLNGKWWEIYGDPALNVLVEQVSISNQNVLQAEAQYREAKAAVREARSSLFPTVSASIGVTQARAGTNAVRLARWRDWTRAAQRVFEEADRCWIAVLPALSAAPVPPPRRTFWRRAKK